jgi:hypothetical protein
MQVARKVHPPKESIGRFAEKPLGTQRRANLLPRNYCQRLIRGRRFERCADVEESAASGIRTFSTPAPRLPGSPAPHHPGVRGLDGFGFPGLAWKLEIKAPELPEDVQQLVSTIQKFRYLPWLKQKAKQSLSEARQHSSTSSVYWISNFTRKIAAYPISKSQTLYHLTSKFGGTFPSRAKFSASGGHNWPTPVVDRQSLSRVTE